MITKSSIMLGLGESDDELKEAMADLRAIDVDILTLGQYLQPTPLHLSVKEYVTPEKFAFWKEYEESIGFRYVASGTTELVSFLSRQWLEIRLTALLAHPIDFWLLWTLCF
ncbi:lipoyl synthase, chloroplastic-like isoform X1 [Quercus lobata]|uniref:lipoyl synthase, chloroplastic-like isoform X1 n=1 Tax=Quercus lobata TaxID=97700 RepID=UPI001248D592|nr:lipoyl synthase, chloroplastic-like isoform X1 [Quercus lobata]